ncbi:MAG: hypothetical protein EHM61_11620 [Acidobacteria bacterium]|nr:MAG: hypothetical protein EHM61_11620 [Acidobacteriota bacterium]
MHPGSGTGTWTSAGDQSRSGPPGWTRRVLHSCSERRSTAPSLPAFGASGVATRLRPGWLPG